MKKSDLLIADKFIANQLALQRFTANEKQEAFKMLLAMQTELKAKLANGFTPHEKKRLEKLLNQCTEIISFFYSGIQTQIDFVELAKYEAEASVKAIAVIGIEAAMPSAAALKAMVNDSLLQGAPLADWWAKQSEDTAFKFMAQVRQGIAQGETLQQIIRRITGSVRLGTVGIMEVSRRNASTLVHDSIMQIANDSRMLTFKANDDIIKGVQQLSTLDSHTSTTCIAYSGASWDLDGKPINGTTLPYNGGCPRHPNCRSVIVPITKTYRELGVDIPEKEPGTRSSDLGQIPADTSFKDFLSRHDDEYLNNILGKGRAQLYRDGKITLSQLVDGQGRELTLKQLKELYK